MTDEYEDNQAKLYQTTHQNVHSIQHVSQSITTLPKFKYLTALKVVAPPSEQIPFFNFKTYLPISTMERMTQQLPRLIAPVYYLISWFP